jgi:hypothetical protein
MMERLRRWHEQSDDDQGMLMEQREGSVMHDRNGRIVK